jgi:SAM-dependent methyltransferase
MVTKRVEFEWSPQVFERLENVRCPFPEIFSTAILRTLVPPKAIRSEVLIPPLDENWTFVEIHAGRGRLYKHLPPELQKRVWQFDLEPGNVAFINDEYHPFYPAQTADVTRSLPLDESSQSLVTSLSGLDVHPAKEKRLVLGEALRILRPGGWFVAYLDLQPDPWPIISKKKGKFWAPDILSDKDLEGEYYGYGVLVPYEILNISVAYRNNRPARHSVVDFLLMSQLDPARFLKLATSEYVLPTIPQRLGLDFRSICALAGVSLEEGIAAFRNWSSDCRHKGLKMKKGKPITPFFNYEKELVKEAEGVGFKEVKPGFAVVYKDMERRDYPAGLDKNRNLIFFDVGTVKTGWNREVRPGQVRVVCRIHFVKARKPR